MDVAAEERTDPQTEWMLQAVTPFIAQSEALVAAALGVSLFNNRGFGAWPECGNFLFMCNGCFNHLRHCLLRFNIAYI